VRHCTVFVAFCDTAASSETTKDAQKIPLHLEVLLIGHCIIAIVTVLNFFITDYFIINWLHTVAYTDKLKSLLLDQCYGSGINILESGS
jgi:hypothetical protein